MSVGAGIFRSDAVLPSPTSSPTIINTVPPPPTLSATAFDTHITPLSSLTINAGAALLITFTLILLLFAILNLSQTLRSPFHLSLGWFLSSRTSSQPDESLSFKSYFNEKRQTHVYDSYTFSKPHAPTNPPTLLSRFSTIPYPKTPLFTLVFIPPILIATFYKSTPLSDPTRTAYIVLALIPPTIALGAKFGGVGTIIQRGYASINWLHRWFARVLWLIATIHVISYLIIFGRTKTLSYQFSLSTNRLALISYLALTTVTVFSIPRIRERYNHVFKPVHHISVLIFLACLNPHTPHLLSYLLPSIFLFVLPSLLIRLYTLPSQIQIAHLQALPASCSTLITLPSLKSGWLPGQYVRIRVLGGGGMGWKSGIFGEAHVFTIAGCEAGGGMRLVVKSCGDWTRKIGDIGLSGAKWGSETSFVDMEKDGRNGEFLPVPLITHVEGPFGAVPPFLSSSSPAVAKMAIITGGSGISYLLSFLSSNWEGEIVGVWSVRGRQAFEEFLPLLEEGIDRRRSLGLRTRIRVYCTGYSYLSPVVLPDAIDVVPERADYAHLLSEEGEEGMGVVACGPKGMVNDVKDVWKGRFWGEEYSL